MRTILTAATALIALSAAGITSAQQAPRSAPTAVPIAPTVPDAADKPYPGVIQLDIDASDIQRGAFRVAETIPVAAGTERLTLLYPMWRPGHHGPRGPLAELAGLTFSAGGKTLSWKRDPVEVSAFHVDVPAGTKEIVARFVYTSPLQASEGRIVMTQEMLNLQWEMTSLYPAGHYVRQIRVRPTVTFPAGWTDAAALDGRRALGGSGANKVTWAETDYETLVDSPVFAGAYFRKWDLGHNVTLNVMADKPEQLEAKPEYIAAHRALVEEALATFGSKHFDRYEFLLALTDRMGGIGLEHQRSSENQLEPTAFTKWADWDWDRGLLPHELAHSWNGKFRRPAKLWTPDYRQPMQGNLLWVYEGQTQFWGVVHAARSGLQSKETVLGQIANWAGTFSEQPGRQWRSVEDTTQDPIFAARKPKPYSSLTRSEDYYTEGALVWLEADQIIRAGTAGRPGGSRGIDDFARAFFGVRPGDIGQLTYEFDDVVAALNGVYPYDWASFLRTRLEMPSQPAPLGGIERGGYRLIWKEEPNPFDKARMAEAKILSLYHSLGLTLDKDGKVTGSRWDSPAFNAGIVTGAKIVAVNAAAYDQDGIKAAITAAKTGKPLDLLIQRGDRYLTVPLTYRGGLRYPWLERAPGKAPAGLDALLAPRRPNAKSK